MINELLIEGRENPKINKKQLQELIDNMDEDDEAELPLKNDDKSREQVLAIFENDLEEVSTTLKTVKEKAFYKYLNKE